MVRIPGDKGPSIKNRSSKHRLLLRDLPKPRKQKAAKPADPQKKIA